MRTPYAACPLCNSADFAPALTHEGIDWMACACGHSFTSGYIPAPGYPPQCQMVGFAHEDLRLPCSRMVERVAQFVPEGIWYDVGFGNGALMFTADEFGYQVSGCDLRPETVGQMRAVGMDADLGDFLSVGRNAHVFSLCDVLEHMPFPKAALLHAHRLLLDDGVLLVSCPNMECASAQFHTSAGTNPYWGEVEHFHNFGRTRLYSLLRECGFEPVSYAVSERYRLGMEVIARVV